MMTVSDKILLSIARDAIEAHLADSGFTPPKLSPPLVKSRGVFVTLWSPGKKLRGCIGTIEPNQSSLAEEVSTNAVSAAVSDPRFPSVTLSELKQLSIEISLLEEPEPIEDESALDPTRYGVIVESGSRRGLLLPGIEGVRTPADQISISKQKAGISEHEAVQLSRFTVTKIGEEK